MITVRFHLGRGANFMHYQIRGLKGKSGQSSEIIEYVDPEKHSIVFHNCRLHNQAKASQKILDGGDKKPCAWLIAESYEVIETIPPTGNQIAFNPRKSAHWNLMNGNEIIQDNIDGMEFKTITTNSNKLYL